MKYSKRIVLLVIVLNVIFTAAEFVATFFGYTVPDALIVAWFAFTGTELVALAGIKCSESKKHEDNDDMEG